MVSPVSLQLVAALAASAISCVLAAPPHPNSYKLRGNQNSRVQDWRTAYGTGSGAAWMGWRDTDSGMTAFAASAGMEPPYWPKNVNQQSDSTSQHTPKTEEKPSGGGRAEASLNAWFPIMVGLYPDSARSADGAGANGRQGITAIASSVNHGSGVASSHAVAYGGGQERAWQHQNQQQTNESNNGQWLRY